MDPEDVRLAGAEIGWLTTVDGSGRPQSSPVWFVHDDGAVWVASEPGAAKVVNVRGHPRVSFHLEGAGPGELVVTWEATATIEDALPPSYVVKYAGGFARLGMTAAEYLARFSSVVRVAPTRRRAFVSE